MKSCGCGRATAGMGSCTICRGTIERGFCGADFSELVKRPDGNWECGKCGQIYYSHPPTLQGVGAAPPRPPEKHDRPEIEEETRPLDLSPLLSGEGEGEGNEKPHEEEEAMRGKGSGEKQKRKYTRRAKKELGEHIATVQQTPQAEVDSLESLMESYLARRAEMNELRGRILAALQESLKLT